jgi:Predicted integral membrane protein
MSKSRLEAFSDGVFAVAITLLVLEIHVPGGDNLWHDLKDEWPSFASFFVSFWVIGIIWVNHHGVLDHLKRADRPVLYLNLLVLMTVVFIPFATALLAEHLKSGADEHVAAAVYSVALLAMGLAFGLLWTYITRHRTALGVELSDEEIRRTSLTFLIGNPFYVVAVIVAFISPAAVLVINGAVAVYYMLVGMRSPEAKETS